MKHKKRPKPVKRLKALKHTKQTKRPTPARPAKPADETRKPVAVRIVDNFKRQPLVVNTTKFSEAEQVSRLLHPALRSAIAGEFRTGLVRSIRSATYLLHMSCVAVNAGLTKSLKDDAQVRLPEPTANCMSAYYEGLLSSLISLVGRRDDILVESTESIHDPRCSRGVFSSRPTAFGIVNVMATCPGAFPVGEKLDQIAEANHIVLGHGDRAYFSSSGARMIHARLLVYSTELALAEKALRGGAAVVAVSPGGVYSADGTKVLGTALLLGVLGELVDLLLAISTLIGVKLDIVVPTVDLAADQLCRTMLGVQFDSHGDLYGSAMMLKLLRENSGLRSLGLLLSEACRRLAWDQMVGTDVRPVFIPPNGCECPKCSHEVRKEFRNLMPDLPGMKMTYRKGSVHEGQYETLVESRLGLRRT